MNELEDDDRFMDEQNEKKLEDVRLSNFAYAQTRISEFLSFILAMLGVGCGIVASEMAAHYNQNGETDTWIEIMLIICNVSTIPLSKPHPCLLL